MAMSRELGNEILHLWKTGSADFSEPTINQALRATGDLCPVERKKLGCVLKDVDNLPHRVWRSALAGGNSAQPIN